jgi:hypothetical protein
LAVVPPMPKLCCRRVVVMVLPETDTDDSGERIWNASTAALDKNDDDRRMVELPINRNNRRRRLWNTTGVVVVIVIVIVVDGDG